MADFVCLSTLLSLVTFPARDGTYVSWWTDEGTPTVIDFVREKGLPLLPEEYLTMCVMQTSTPYLLLFDMLFGIVVYPNSATAKEVSQTLWNDVYESLQDVAPPEIMHAERQRAERAEEAALAAEAYLESMPPE